MFFYNISWQYIARVQVGLKFLIIKENTFFKYCLLPGNRGAEQLKGSGDVNCDRYPPDSDQ